MRIVQSGFGPVRNVLLTFFFGTVVAAVAQAIPREAMVVAIDKSKEPVNRAQLAALVRQRGAELGEIAVGGFSAGCHGLRDVLERVQPNIIFPIDGTHGSIPQPGSMPLGPWERAVARARAGQLTIVATHTYNTYTDLLPKGAFMCTVGVLRKILGWELPEPTDGKPATRLEGNIAVYSYASGACDGAAHGRQLTSVAPEVIDKWLRARWSSAPVATSPREPLALPHGTRCSVRELIEDAKRLGRWRPAGSGYTPKRGDAICSGRNGANPAKGGEGHIETAMVDAKDPMAIIDTIGANEDNGWKVAPFDLSSPTYVGTIERGPLGEKALDVALEEYAMHVHELAGLQHHPRIQMYHACARRGGGPTAGMPGNENDGAIVLGSRAADEIAWCASALSFCAFEAAQRAA